MTEPSSDSERRRSRVHDAEERHNQGSFFGRRKGHKLRAHQADLIEHLLPQLQSSLPASVKLQVLTDRTNTIHASVKDVQFELMLTISLVVLVIFLLLAANFQSIRLAVAIILTVPAVLAGVLLMLLLLLFGGRLVKRREGPRDVAVELPAAEHGQQRGHRLRVALLARQQEQMLQLSRHLALLPSTPLRLRRRLLLLRLLRLLAVQLAGVLLAEGAVEGL